MNSSRWMLRSLCASAPLLFAGCMYPGPYTYGTYPGYYSPPPGYAAPPPGGTIVTPGPSFPQPQLGPPSGAAPTWSPTPSAAPIGPTPASPLPGPSTPPGNSTFDNSPAPFNSGARKPGDILVPAPTDRDRDLGPSMPPSSARPNSANTPFGSDGSKSSFGEGAQITIPQRNEMAAHAVGTVDPQTFERPIENERHDREELVTVSARADLSGQSLKGTGPYDYDRVGYTWLRGTVDFDQRDRSWHIIYSQHPDPRDRFGGAIRLIDHPKLGTRIRHGDVVYVEGRIDARRLDSRGKPQYRIEADQITRIGLGGSIQSMGN